MPGRLRSLIVVLLVVAVTWGCASSIALTDPPVAKQTPPSLSHSRARIGTFGGAACFGEEVKRYLSSPGGLVLAADENPSDLIISGVAKRVEVHSNLGDKQAAMAYFTAFVITAPIAAAMYGAKDWQADAVAEGELVASDAKGNVVWKKDLTVSITENQRSMPSDEVLKTALSEAVCQKLAATLLNGLTEHLASSK